MTRFEVGDYVLVRGKVVTVGDDDELGYCVELFSKTDQYGAWVRPDLVIEKVKTPTPPEPSRNALVVDGSGDCWSWDPESDTSPPWRCGDLWLTWEALFRDYGPLKVYEESAVYEN